jgi:hypothetical protein
MCLGQHALVACRARAWHGTAQAADKALKESKYAAYYYRQVQSELIAGSA